MGEEPEMTSLPLIRFTLLDSTQSFLVRHPELGFCGVLAEEQTSGRGRGENRWESAPGAGLWFSAALPIQAVSPGLVLQRAMAAVVEVLEPCGLKLGLKWPNDLVAWKEGRLVKLGGIIGEFKGDRMILGLGLNLRAAPSLLERPIPPACLMELGASDLPDFQTLAQSILQAWQDLTIQREPGFWWPTKGDAIQWEEGHGSCEGWLEDGRLEVRTETGLEELCMGDLSGLGMAQESCEA